jgi:hypothetical protein
MVTGIKDRETHNPPTMEEMLTAINKTAESA